ncbi:uncharacterized protein LOC128671304 [Plodia interpunctella]|uniref:uncharacterized protein LOC128671304 n=1 Tax=Plodia interpunctella TaxID=58824 RepID=UPI002368B04D|nr:uncharacterized protein LOC128671304 isoform X2 [Plodia interpunctella]
MQISMSMSFGYSLKLNLGLFEGTKEMFFQKITQPLLKLVQDLKSSEKELRFLLNKKDLEIEEYKSEGAQVVRHFKTSKFDEEKHMNQFKAYSECFGSSDIPNSILERTVDLPEIIIVKQEPAPVKTEPSLPVIKSEPATPVFDDQTVHGTVCVKREHAIGGRSHVSIDAMRLKRSKLNL